MGHEQPGSFSSVAPCSRDPGPDAVDVEADVHAVGDGLLMAVFHDEVLLKKPMVCFVGVAVSPIRKASK